MKTCGQCEHGKAIPEDLTKRACKGAPPQIMLLPNRLGQVEIKQVFPTMNSTEEACGLFKQKVLTPPGFDDNA